METEEERRARLENVAATKRFSLAVYGRKSMTGEDGSYLSAQVGHGDGQKKEARLEKMVATTHLRLALETEEERRAKNGLDLTWIEIGFF